MDADTARGMIFDSAPPSLARLYREFGDRWDIEQVPSGARWVAVLRESGGDGVRVIAAHDVHALRFRLSAAEHAEPAAEPETGSAR